MRTDAAPNAGSDQDPKDPNRKRGWDAWHAVLGALAVALGITSIWLWTEVADEKSDARERITQGQHRLQRMLGEQEAESSRALSATREEAAQHQAKAFAAALQPMMSFKGQVPEITNRTIQAAAENLARQGSYSLVAVTDGSGKVIGSSDLTLVGRDFGGDLQEGVRQVRGENQAVSPIGTDGSAIGHVVIRVRVEQ